MKIADNTLIISLFSVDNTKLKRGWDIPSFNYMKIKEFHVVLRQL